jgi:predicted ATPase/class 3 adenylate cyclase/Tfp pilus assembly protein PilF
MLELGTSPIGSPPSGTVTFMFTDIEGSTRLWEESPDAMRAALARHDAILREAIESNGGYVFKTGGDSFYAAFPTGRDALAAAIAAQTAIRQEDWEHVAGNKGIRPLKVRMALHTGTAEERDGDYFGQPLNRVARLQSAAHGGQVLLSLTTEELVRDQLPKGVTLDNLGEHRLKDLQRPEQVFQLVFQDFPATFPPLKTLNNHPNNLPVQLTPLVGRVREVDAISSLLLRTDVRLVTLTGPGGTGKTRLGLQVVAELVDDFEDGVFFVSLAPISDPALVASAIGQTLGVREVAGQTLAQSLRDYFRDKQMLLLLDNFEQVVSAAPVVTDLLAFAPRLKILVTSREMLHVSGEHDFPVPPLTLPDPNHLPQLEQLTKYEAVRLFIERALALKPDFVLTQQNAEAVARICHRLDGLPLAIELAAARITILSPQAMLARLQSRLKLLTGGARDLPARQQTLRNAIDWSYNLLDEGEQALFRWLSVFVGGCTLEAAEEMCSAQFSEDVPDLDVLEGLASLVSKSLLRQVEGPDGGSRFTMLETIREYGLERLSESGEADALQAAHAHYYLRLAEQAEERLGGGPDQLVWLASLEAEHGNMRAALAWLRSRAESESPGLDYVELGLRLAGALGRFWEVHGHVTEGREQLALFLSTRRGDGAGTPGRAKALSLAGRLAYVQGDYAGARSLYEESLEVWRELGSRAGRAGKAGMARALNGLAVLASDQGDHTEARSLFGAGLALYRERDDKAGVAGALINLGIEAVEEGDYAAASSLFQESLELQRELGHKEGIAESLGILGEVVRYEGDYATARSLYEQSLALHARLGDKLGIATQMHNLGYVALHQGDLADATSLFKESLAMARQLGSKRSIAICLVGLGAVALAEGQHERATRLFAAAGSLLEQLGAHLSPVDQSEYAANIATARAQLGEGWNHIWAEGRAMTIEQAVENALEAAPEPV